MSDDRKSKEQLLKELSEHVEVRKQAEAEKRLAEEWSRKLSSVVEQTDDSVVITDREGVIQYVNPAFEKKTGYRKEEAIGRTPRIVKSGVQGDIYYLRLWETILAGGVFRGALVNKKKNGELYYEEKTITPLKDDQGIIIAYVSTGKDITERKKIEEELERVRIKKERLEAIRALSMTYAHNVLNAITPAKSAAEILLKKTEPSDPRQRWVRTILEGISEAVRAIRQLHEIDSEQETRQGGVTLLEVNPLKKKGRPASEASVEGEAPSGSAGGGGDASP